MFGRGEFVHSFIHSFTCSSKCISTDIMTPYKTSRMRLFTHGTWSKAWGASDEHINGKRTQMCTDDSQYYNGITQDWLEIPFTLWIFKPLWGLNILSEIRGSHNIYLFIHTNKYKLTHNHKLYRFNYLSLLCYILITQNK